MCGDYAAAVKCYIMAGAIDSMFFVKDVSTNVWSQQVFLVCNIRLRINKVVVLLVVTTAVKLGHMHLKYNANLFQVAVSLSTIIWRLLIVCIK